MRWPRPFARRRQGRARRPWLAFLGAFWPFILGSLLVAGGLAAIVLGYVTLAAGSTVAAPLLLVLGYAVLIPLGIIL